MKRIKELHQLSADHHLGLVVARRAKLAAEGREGYTVENMWREVEEKFPLELEPHFRIEEQFLAPHMEEMGETEMIERFKRDHRELRAALDPAYGRTGEALKRFAILLEKHIRFEERELFERAQEVLSPHVFSDIEEACRKSGDKE